MMMIHQDSLNHGVWVQPADYDYCCFQCVCVWVLAIAEPQGTLENGYTRISGFTAQWFPKISQDWGNGTDFTPTPARWQWTARDQVVWETKRLSEQSSDSHRCITVYLYFSMSSCDFIWWFIQYISLDICTWTCTSTCVHTCPLALPHVHTHVHMHTHMYTHMFIFTCSFLSLYISMIYRLKYEHVHW